MNGTELTNTYKCPKTADFATLHVSYSQSFLTVAPSEKFFIFSNKIKQIHNSK